MDCVLFRHGIAVAREEWKGTDAERPLTEKGTQRVREVAEGLRRLKIRPSVIYASPARRAVDTAQLLLDLLEGPSCLQLRAALLPDAPAESLLSVLQDLPAESCVICVGHEPQLGMAASLLLSGHSSPSFPMKKAGAALIELAIPAMPGRGFLHWWLTPGMLRAIGKKNGYGLPG